jgi:hypothetical protein
MKTIIKLSLGMFLVLLIASCTKNFDKINTNPNQPAKVPTPYLLTAAQKGLCDNIYDEWWGGRQSMLFAQYWCQRSYPTEDRYSIRENVNNNYWRLIYHDVMNLVQIININTNADTKAEAAVYGDNDNQIAVATILKIWTMQIMADTYGDIPYSQAFKGSDPTTPTPTPAYDKLQDIYAAFQTELKEAVNRIKLDAPGFTSGDIIYNGDMALWKKFGNSLRLRVALRMSNTDNYAAAKAIMNEEGIEFLTSNADNAAFYYLGAEPNNSPLYDAWFTSNRNDFTTCKTLINLLKGVDDTLNNKINPIKVAGMVDPRLQIYTRPRNGKYLGMPYGMTEAPSQAYAKYCATWANGYVYSTATAPVILNSRYATVYMEYAEVEFMLCELNNWDPTHYANAVRASIEHWRDISVDLEGWDAVKKSDFNTAMEDYLAALPPASKETVLAHKYLAFYDQAYQAWFEYNRTGEPAYLLQPGEHTSVDADGNFIDFKPLITITTIPKRMTYPQQEYTVNGASVNAAATSIGKDLMSTKIWWEPAGK